MYSYLEGKLINKSPAQVTLDVNGVGYEVNISLNTYSAVQSLDHCKLFIHLQVKEDSHTLFGFFDKQEKEMFQMLISVSGVGAATARMMLSYIKPEEIVQAIGSGNVRLLESVKGIGKKTAERLVLELKDKTTKIQIETGAKPLVYNSLETDSLNALMALGISKVQAENAIKKVRIADSTINNLEDLIKKALKAI